MKSKLLLGLGFAFAGQLSFAQSWNAPFPQNDATFILNPDMSDEFNSGTTFDPLKWTWDPTDVAFQGGTCYEGGTDFIEIQSDGTDSYLRLSVKEYASSINCGGESKDYGMGALFGLNEQQYGYFEARVRIPDVPSSPANYRGMSATVWMWGNWQTPANNIWSEIDLAEINSRNNLFTCNVHYDPHENVPGSPFSPDPWPTTFPLTDEGGNNYWGNADGRVYQSSPTWWGSYSHETMRCGPNNLCNDEVPDCHDVNGENYYDQNITGGWHIFSAHWTPDYIAIYLDGELVNKTTVGCPGMEPLNWVIKPRFSPNQFQEYPDANTILPYYMDIDYIRTYTEEPCGGWYDPTQIDHSMVSGDFDRDGYEDDVAAMYDYGFNQMRFHVWSSDAINSDKVGGNSGWYTSYSYDATKSAGRVVSGDFDQDGFRDDIAAFYEYPDSRIKIHVWTSTGGSFVYEGAWYSTGTGIYNAAKIKGRVVCGDFDQDGFEDDICTFYDYGGAKTAAHVWKSNGGGFGSVSTYWSTGYGIYDATKIMNRVVSGDFDGDGFRDEVAALYEYPFARTKIHVWNTTGCSPTNPSTCTFTSAAQWYDSGMWVFDASKIKGTVVSGDFDRDGLKDDILTMYGNSPDRTRAFVFKSTGAGFNSAEEYYDSGYNNFDHDEIKGRLVSGDFDNDGKLDDAQALYSGPEDGQARLFTWETVTAGDDFAGPFIYWRTCPAEIVQGPHNNCNKAPIGTGVEEDVESDIEANGKFSCNIYPNPSTGLFHVELVSDIDDKGLEVTVYTLDGRRIFNKSMNSKNMIVDLSDFQSGTYVVEISNGIEILREKISKQ